MSRLHNQTMESLDGTVVGGASGVGFTKMSMLPVDKVKLRRQSEIAHFGGYWDFSEAWRSYQVNRQPQLGMAWQ